MDQMEIGKFIAELRKEKGMTQVELGDKIGVTNKTISRWENANYMPDISIMPLLCTELEISINELLIGKRLNDVIEFKQTADENLLQTFKQVKKIKKEQSIMDFFTGSGTGILLSCLLSSASQIRTIIMVVGLTMIIIGWYRKAKYDKKIMEYMK